ncbi:hypothetical protein HDU83_006840 [Entophlyctis luteolus]|nr:hypothetical protein HDU83_006840 [Entophlyctis luteolus]
MTPDGLLPDDLPPDGDFPPDGNFPADNPPDYSDIGLAHSLYFTQPQMYGVIAVTTVSSSPDHNFLSSAFSIEYDTSAQLRFFRVVPNGQNIDPDSANDFYYSFRLFTASATAEAGGNDFFRIAGGRGKATPNQVSPHPAFMIVGRTKGNKTFAEFFNPFKSRQDPDNRPLTTPSIINRRGGPLTRYSWVSKLEDGGADHVFQLERWEDDGGRRYGGAAENRRTAVVAEIHVSESGEARLFPVADETWESIEECAFVVGTAYAAYVARDVKYREQTTFRSMKMFLRV